VVPVRARAAVAVVLALLVTPAAAGAATREQGAPLGRRLEQALHAPHVSPAASGAAVLDLSTGRAVFLHNPSLPLLPASNEKLAVTYAALTALGPAFRIETDVLGEGSQDGSLWTGNIVLKGYGDPTLSSAGLASLARQVRAAGITRIAGRVVGDETWFDARRTSPGWKAAFYIEESPPLSALIVDRGLVGRYTSHNPALAAARLFRKALVRVGIRIAGGAVLGAVTPSAVILGSIDSPTLGSIVNFMDHESDNFTAEMLVKELGAVQAGRGTTAAGVGVVTGLLTQAHVPMQGVRIVDGSGLSLLDRMTAGALVSLLGVMWNDPGVRPELLASLPVAGRNGTLADRMQHTAATGVVRAKTGTTDNASALSGFVGDRYAFSVLENGWPVSTTWARTTQDRFATVLARSP
jgi:D-alanyl-D-alanine carboxypeptidase/D-alanyl-D-alanine-endopeptidase (penicillin-binding protein 4)